MPIKPQDSLLEKVITKGTFKEVGRKDDEGKPEWLLFPFGALEEILKVLMFGKNQYGADNWKKVPNAKKRYSDALMRHITAYFGGEKRDPKSGLFHLAHAGCCILFLLWFELKSNKTKMK